jgi:hypothetical protein
VYQPSGLGDGLFVYQSVHGDFDRILTTRDIPVSGNGSFSGSEWTINNATPSDGGHKAVFGNTSIYYGSRAGFLFQPSSSSGKTAQLVYQPAGLGDGVFIYQSVYGNFDRILTTRDVTVQSGNIAIGTTTIPAGYKLAVNGAAIATSVKVQPHGDWPDFVFKQDYELPALTQVKAYIDKNQHLPDMPSAKEVQANGLDLGEMNRLLLKKVEELTLYLMDEHSKNAEQENRIKALETALKNQK